MKNKMVLFILVVTYNSIMIGSSEVSYDWQPRSSSLNDKNKADMIEQQKALEEEYKESKEACANIRRLDMRWHLYHVGLLKKPEFEVLPGDDHKKCLRKKWIAMELSFLTKKINGGKSN